MTIIQSPFQLPENEYTKGIIANTQLLYVLEGTEVVYDAVIKTFMIKNNAHINQMKSIQNNYDCTHPYSECWIRFGENYALTVVWKLRHASILHSRLRERNVLLWTGCIVQTAMICKRPLKHI